MADSPDSDEPTCRSCGDPVDAAAKHRVASTVEDGEAVHRYFCDDDCLESWRS